MAPYTVMTLCNGSEVMTSSMTFNGSDIQLGSEDNEISVNLVGLDPFTFPRESVQCLLLLMVEWG